MSVTLVLVTYAAALGAAGPAILRQARWADRAPRLAIVVWQAATASVLASAVLAGLTLTMPAAGVRDGLAELLDACLTSLHLHYAVGQPLAAAFGFLTAAAVVAWTGGHGAVALVAASWRRRRHAEALSLVARHRDDLDALVLDCDKPAAYCLPGRRRRVVVTTAALAMLDRDQLRAVLAHERAHLDERHHLVLAAAEAVDRAFPGVPLFRHARAEIARLIELLADDIAARRHKRRTVAAALLTVAATPVPADAFGAAGQGVFARIRRLLVPHQPLGRGTQALASAAVGLLLTVPLVVAADAAAFAVLAHHCPLLH
ncbi:MAG: M48 family metalloprotease [Streptosporangiales bacterium]|nr:M48 family metalloprotease [Streptosporangiales bacterium]